MRNLLYVVILLSVPACASENAHSRQVTDEVSQWDEANSVTVNGQGAHTDSNVCDAGYVPSCTTVLGHSSCVCEDRKHLDERYSRVPGQRGLDRNRRLH